MRPLPIRPWPPRPTYGGVEFWRVEPKHTANGKPKVHIVYRHDNQLHDEDGVFITLHDIEQGTHDWPWPRHQGHIQRATNEQWQKRPCQLCLAAIEGRPLPGRV